MTLLIIVMSISTVLQKYNPFFELFVLFHHKKSESIISDLGSGHNSLPNSAKKKYRNFYSFEHSEGDNFVQFDVKATKYYEILLHLNHLVLNDHLSYFYLFLFGLIGLTISIISAIATVQHLVGNIGYVVIDFIILSCLIFPIGSFSWNILLFMQNNFPSPIHYLNDLLRIRSSKLLNEQDSLNPIHYYASESLILRFIEHRGIEVAKQVLDINKMEYSTLGSLLLMLLEHHFLSNSVDDTKSVPTSQPKLNQFIPLEEIQMTVIREGVFEDGLKSKVTSKNDKNGLVIDDRNVIIGSSCVSNAVLDPVAILILGEKGHTKSKKKIHDLSIIMKSLHSRELLIFETIRPTLIHTKLIYKKLKILLK